MSGTKALLDSNAIIYASKGIIDAERMLSLSETYYISIITFIEIYSFDSLTEMERSIINEISDGLDIVEVNAEIAEQAVLYRKNRSKKIKLPDAVILATSKVMQADLFTANVRDFQNVDPSVNVCDLEQFRPQ